jgi:hypothetical protein
MIAVQNLVLIQSYRRRVPAALLAAFAASFAWSAGAAEPATVAGAAKVLDLRTFPRMVAKPDDQATPSGQMSTLGMLMYEASGV